MRKIFIILFIIGFKVSFGQYTSEDSDEKTNPLSKLTFKDRLYTGGNMAFNVQTLYGVPVILFEASPFVGYRITPDFSMGIGAKYLYIGSKQANFKYSIYGGNVFSRYKFTESLFAHAEFEVLRAYNLDPNSPNQNDRATVPMLFAGAGYSSNIGGTINLQLMILYEFIDHINSPYQGGYIFGPAGPPLIYRVGISIGM